MKKHNYSFTQICIAAFSLTALLTFVFFIDGLFLEEDKVLTVQAEEKVSEEAVILSTIQIDTFSTYEELLLQLESKGISSEEFLSITNDKTQYEEWRKEFSFLPAYQKDVRYLLEGYLYSNEYHFEKGNMNDLIRNMLSYTDQLLREATTNYNHDLLNQYSISEIITLASIVEKESAQPTDRKVIAGVFLNRLNDKMKIQSDVTVLYALGKGMDKTYYKDLKVESPYNTYYVKGLPIAPINTPSIESIQSVLYATPSNYYFFFGTGVQTIFAETFDEHKENIAKNR